MYLLLVVFEFWWNGNKVKTYYRDKVVTCSVENLIEEIDKFADIGAKTKNEWRWEVKRSLNIPDYETVFVAIGDIIVTPL